MTLKRLILYIVCLLFVMPIWAWQETVTVGAGMTQTLPTSVDSRVQGVADALGLTLLGWTPGEIADGQRPTTYYGLGATVTPDVETTYYAMFARANEGGEVMIRQCASPANGDSVLLATIISGVLWLAPNGLTNDMQLKNDYTSYWSGSLIAHTVGSSNSLVWKYIAQPDSKFNLQSTLNEAYYLNVNAGNVKSGTTSSNVFIIQNAFLYNPYNTTYLQYKIKNGYVYWSIGSLPSSQSFAFYRKERYVDFATEIGQLPGCANCFIYVP